MASAETPEKVKQKRIEDTSTVSFPGALGKHKTILIFKDYSYSSLNEATDPFASFVYRGAVELPLPENLQDGFSLGVQGDELGALSAGVSELTGSVSEGTIGSKVASALNEAGERGTSLGKSIGNFRNNDIAVGDALYSAFSTASDATQFFLRSALAGVSPDLARGIGVGTGKALNPFATLTFTGVSLKSHELTWKLSPETEQESENLNRIVNIIKRNSLPLYSNPIGDNSGDELGGLNVLERGLLEYPSFVEVIFEGIDENYFYKIKRSMISNIAINYTPDGKSILRGGRPSAITLSITLQESSIHTGDEYGKKKSVDAGESRTEEFIRASEAAGENGEFDYEYDLDASQSVQNRRGNA